jgi:molybdopterin biosynthesis enzyme
MLSVREARNRLARDVASASGIGSTHRKFRRVLAEDVMADADMPPFPRSTMDGYAVRGEDVSQAPAKLQVVGFVPAGVFPNFSLLAMQAAKIMTGAPLPPAPTPCK